MPDRFPWRPALALSALAVAVVASRDQLGDYTLEPNEDNAAPAIHLLADGRLGDAIDVMPAMGTVSLLLRVPAAAVAGSDLLLAHRLGSLLCLAVVVALALVVDRRAASDGRSLTYRCAVGLVMVAGPGILTSIDAGHPEEYLGGALCVGAVLAAVERRTLLAAVCLGLAIGTKQWALLAIAPALLPIGEPRWLDPQRLKAGALAAAIAAVFVVPPILASPSRYFDVSQSLSSTSRVYAESIWWPVATEQTKTIAVGSGETAELTTRALPLGLTRGAATFLAVLASLALVPIALRRGGLRDPLAALTALLVLRAVVDPMNLDYYLAPALLALAAWEVWRGPPGGLPVVSIAAAAVTLAVWTRGADGPQGLYWALWMCATLPLLFVARLGRSPTSQPQ